MFIMTMSVLGLEGFFHSHLKSYYSISPQVTDTDSMMVLPSFHVCNEIIFLDETNTMIIVIQFELHYYYSLFFSRATDRVKQTK